MDPRWISLPKHAKSEPENNTESVTTHIYPALMAIPHKMLVVASSKFLKNVSELS